MAEGFDVAGDAGDHGRFERADGFGDLDDERLADAEFAPPPGLREIVAGWQVPAGAVRAEQLRTNILAAIDMGLDDPQLVADMAVGPLTVLVGRLEAGLADARRRISDLERAVTERDR